MTPSEQLQLLVAPTSTQQVLVAALWAIVLMPVVGFIGAVFLNWSQLLMDSRPIRYWTPKQTLWGVGLAIVCAALLVGAATLSLRRPVEGTAPAGIAITWRTDDILALYSHAAEEFDKGRRDEELWALATVARSSPDQQRDWYLAERVKKLKEIAEEQLRREGIL